jgi:hypothetical protein
VELIFSLYTGCELEKKEKMKEEAKHEPDEEIDEGFNGTDDGAVRRYRGDG